MRNSFINTLMLSERKDLFLLTGDLGFSVLEQFQRKWPDNFINAGVAEQNLTGIAAGLAMEGFKVFTYSIANFNTLRCIEQIRNDICYNNLDVTIVSVGGGFVYGSAGYSHHAVQDISIMWSLPGITLLLPNTPFETEWCVNYALNNKGPKYLRIGKNGEKEFYKTQNSIEGINLIRSEKESSIAIITAGGMLPIADEVNNILTNDGLKSDLYSIPIVHSSGNCNYNTIFNHYNYIFVIEEHIKDTGLTAVLRSVIERDNQKIISFGIDKNKCREVGNQDYLRKIHGIDSATIVSNIKNILIKSL